MLKHADWAFVSKLASSVNNIFCWVRIETNFYEIIKISPEIKSIDTDINIIKLC